jgi:hypothetical protein
MVQHLTGGETMSIFYEYQAIIRAEAMLIAHLDETQREDWAYGRFFYVVGSQTRARYVVHFLRYYNVGWIGKSFTNSLCLISADRDIPLCDVLLAQKLMIETDEPLFLARANLMPRTLVSGAGEFDAPNS